jgi:hypothetical protein
MQPPPTSDIPTTPRNWCAHCGRALWPWSTIYEYPSLAGLVVLCRQCAGLFHGAVPTTWDRPLLGQRDIARWSAQKKDHQL